MSAALQTIGSFAAAVFGWLLLEFVGRPLRKFYDLRGEIISQLVQYANLRAHYKVIYEHGEEATFEEANLSEDEIRRLDTAQASLRTLAARMSAFAGNESFALWVTRTLGYNPQRASAGLMGLSNTLQEYSRDRTFHRTTLADALKIKDMPGLPTN
jgi:hypothetical protein